MFKYKRKIGIGNLNSRSLRVNIPKEIVDILSVNAGDSIEYKVDIGDNKEVTIIFDKAG